jgi:hypothetical protein
VGVDDCLRDGQRARTTPAVRTPGLLLR